MVTCDVVLLGEVWGEVRWCEVCSVWSRRTGSEEGETLFVSLDRLGRFPFCLLSERGESNLPGCNSLGTSVGRQFPSCSRLNEHNRGLVALGVSEWSISGMTLQQSSSS